MPYTIRKRSCKQSSGKKGNYTLSYTDKHGKSHSNCHTSKKGAQAQIAAIEGPKESVVRMFVREILKELNETNYSLRSTFFRNPYEDPGSEFEVDEEDPIHLQLMQKRREYKEELRGADGEN